MDIKNDFATNLVGHWELEEAIGTRYDSTANGIDLTDINTVRQKTGKQGNCADFERDNTEYLTVVDANITAVSGDLTLSFWRQFETVSTTRQYDFFIADKVQFASLDYSGGYILACYYRDYTGFYLHTVPWGFTPSTATWYHIGMTRKQSTGETKFYVNGSQVGSTQTGRTDGLRTDAGSTFILGYEADGLIDEASFWSRELSATEMSNIYNSGAGIPYEASGGPTGTNMQINIGDTFKEVSAMKINIGDTWRDVASVKINVGDVWKTVF